MECMVLSCRLNCLLPCTYAAHEHFLDQYTHVPQVFFVNGPSCLRVGFGAFAGGGSGFFACAALYAIGNACIGASPMAYAADVMPADLGGFGLGMYRCAGDLGMRAVWIQCLYCALQTWKKLQRLENLLLVCATGVESMTLSCDMQG